MKPLVAIVGRPNVGKSTLFNRLVGERRAIVEDLPGTTRDRLYGDAEWNGRVFTLVDTGGLELGASDSLLARIAAQARLAIEEADVIVLLVDARDGITSADSEVADLLRRSHKPIVLGANKADNPARRQESVEFYSLGLGEPITLSATQGTGTGDLLDAITDALPEAEDEEEDETPGLPRLAIVGRPNVGKSSLVNNVLGQDRVIVSEIAGTTRDAIDTEVEHDGRRLVLVDTAGIRRRGRVGAGVEKYSVLRATRAIDRCDVAILLIDAAEGITAQDTHIAGYIHEVARGVVIVVNKWDIVREQRRAREEADRAAALAEALLEGALEAGAAAAPVALLPPLPPLAQEPPGDVPTDAKGFLRALRERFKFMPYAPIVFAAATTGYHTGPILDHALRIYDERARRIPTAQLNEVVRDAVQRHNPPTNQGRTLRVFYATQAEVSPPTFVFFVNDPEINHFSYERYLENRLREAFGFEGTAIRLQFRARSTRDDGEDNDGKRSRPGKGPGKGRDPRAAKRPARR
ncbi:MAG TPA: ribosome biogenesis GTPase Der [Ktedonobacterales bacterium]|jgi:GTP-binding protein